jgi:hypothetical protein
MDSPSAQFRRDLRRKLGVAVGAAGVTTATASAKALGGVLLKWLTLGFTIGMVGAGTASYVTRPVERGASVQPSASAPRSVRRPAALGEGPAHDPLPSGPSSAASAVDAPASSGVSASHTNMPPAAASGATAIESRSATNREDPAGQTQLSEQIAAIKAARAALASHDASRALSDIDQYEHTYPAGLFSVESQVLRIDALLELGRYVAARELARQFLAAEPDSPYAQHVRSVASAAARTN